MAGQIKTEFRALGSIHVHTRQLPGTQDNKKTELNVNVLVVTSNHKHMIIKHRHTLAQYNTM